MRVFLTALLSWLIGLSAILITSYFLYETPGLQDAMGFGGLLLAGSIVLIIIYTVLLSVLRNKINAKTILFIYPLMLAVVVNSPLYFLLWIHSGKKFGPGEGLLFFIGFITVALVFGVGNAMIHLKNETKH